MKTKEQWEQEVREDTLVDADQLVDWIGEIQSDARADLEAENKALNQQVNDLIGRCKELAAEIMPVRERTESAEASFKERDLQMKAALEETESMFQRTQRAETDNMELRERLKKAEADLAKMTDLMEHRMDQRDKAEAACAEMRSILVPMRAQLLTRTPERDKWDHALSSTCGQPLLDRMKAMENILDRVGHTTNCCYCVTETFDPGCPACCWKALNKPKP